MKPWETPLKLSCHLVWWLMVDDFSKGLYICSCTACFFEFFPIFLEWFAHILQNDFTVHDFLCWSLAVVLHAGARQCSIPSGHQGCWLHRHTMCSRVALMRRLTQNASDVPHVSRTLMDIRAWVWCKQPIRKSSLRPATHKETSYIHSLQDAPMILEIGKPKPFRQNVKLHFEHALPGVETIVQSKVWIAWIGVSSYAGSNHCDVDR